MNIEETVVKGKLEIEIPKLKANRWPQIIIFGEVP